ncbi:manganese efflux pump [Candidatus Bathyarchaeota archaeon]|nr:manganese efflux pump [Candidatus Bathyarchaeota archaeon]
MDLDVISLILIAIGMSMDVFSVSCITGFGLKSITQKQVLKIATSFGVFHIFMPILGWFAGSSFVNMISEYDHWVAFLLLLYVGGKMIFSAINEKKEINSVSYEILNNNSLLMFSLAVSIDSIAIGLSFSLENIAILIPAIVIGISAFLFTFIGVKIGCLTGSKFGKRAEILGGLILIGIGIRILYTHIIL